MKRAYRTTLIGITSIVSAESRGKAIARTLLSAADAGYNVRGKWKEVRAVRAPEHDEWAALDATGVLWAEANLPKGVVT